MVRDRLNKIFASKAFYIVFSLLVSIALWLFVELSQNPTSWIQINNVQVVYLNEDLLHDKNFVITKMSPQTLTIKIECKRELQLKLNASTIYVTVDLANITKTGTTMLDYEIVYPIPKNQITNVTPTVDKLAFTVDKLYTKTIPVVGEYKGGTPSEDLQSGAVEFNPSTITIFGPEEAVARVDRAWVDIRRENLQRTTVMEDLPFILQDVGGEMIDEALLEGLEATPDTVNATIPIKQTKDVPLRVDLIHGAGTNDQNVKVTISPMTITVTGEPDAMYDFNSLTLGTIDLTKIETMSATEAFSIVVPNSFSYQGESEAYVTVEIIGLETRHFQATNLQTVNPPKGMKATILTMSFDIRIRGRTEDLDAIRPESIRVVADLTDYKEGSASVPVKIFIDGNDSDVGPVGSEYRMPVTIMKE